MQTYFLVNNLPCLNVKKSRRQRLKPGRRSCLSKTNTVFFGRLGADTKFDWLAQIAANPFLKTLQRCWLLKHFLIIVLRKKAKRVYQITAKEFCNEILGIWQNWPEGACSKYLCFQKCKKNQTQWNGQTFSRPTSKILKGSTLKVAWIGSSYILQAFI